MEILTILMEGNNLMLVRKLNASRSHAVVELVLNCSLLNCYVGCVDWSVLQPQHSPADTEGKCFLSSCLP